MPLLDRVTINTRLLQLLLLALPILLPPVVLAQEQPKVEDTCLSYESEYESAPLFAIKPAAGQQRVYMYKATRLCSNDKPCASRQKSFLVSGDVVFAGPPDKGFRCAYYGSAKGKIIAGFVPVENLESFTEDDALSLDFISGDWNYEDDSIDIKPGSGNQVSADGQAYYKTDLTVNEGSLSATAILTAGQKSLTFKEGNDETSCVVVLHRRGPYLVASDNGNCGGLNVSFSGIYTKARKAK